MVEPLVYGACGRVVPVILGARSYARADQRAAAPAADATASADQLKSQAFTELRAGHFEKSTELLDQAATLVQDPSLTRMVAWAGSV